MSYFKNFKTSERISLSFALFGFFSLLLFLVLINITYFFIWYQDQKEMSFSDMNQTYQSYLNSDGKMEDVESFKNYLLSGDTIIIPNDGKLICSPGVSKKIHEDPNIIQDKLFHKDGETIYFIYSKFFPYIGEVKVLFDTTPYITSQMIIIKTGLIFIVLVFILQFFAGKYISHRLLRDLKNISEKLKKVDIHSQDKHITCNMPKNDEIRILAEALNSSYDTIDIQTSKLKQFLTDVSHEFKTPLMGMSSELDLLEKKREKSKLDDAGIQKYSLNTKKSISKLNTLLETLFFLSRIEEKSGCLVKKPLEIQDYFEKKMRELAHNFPHKTISYELTIEKDLYYDVEESTFSILLDNLLSNALKFSSQETKLIIQANTAYFSLEDNGIGIDDTLREKIWDKFYRKDTKVEGFGIGLYIVKRLIDIYDWNIQLESNQGTGAKFIIYM